MIRIQYVQHVPYEGIGIIEQWITDRGHTVEGTRIYRYEQFPDLEGFDWLILMGGPMSVGDERQYPWLVKEKHFIDKAISRNKTVLGICLGAQLIAEVLGARVYRHRCKEIGWFPITFEIGASKNGVFENMPNTITVFHWHGDTFDIPAGADHAAGSECCRHQAFVRDANVVGLQFHLELTLANAVDLIDNCGSDLEPGKYVQSCEDIMSESARFDIANEYMKRILTNLERR